MAVRVCCGGHLCVLATLTVFQDCMMERGDTSAEDAMHSSSTGEALGSLRLSQQAPATPVPVRLQQSVQQASRYTTLAQ